jgi:hypothetical protein
MDLAPFVASFLGGGLAGGSINVWYQWRNRQKDLRTKFYPVLNNMHSAYVIRMNERPEGRYWVTIVGQNPSADDEQFVDHRSNFISDLIQFNDLKEARVLRKAILDNGMKGHHTPGILTKLDLNPEAVALGDCLKTLHDELKLDRP